MKSRSLFLGLLVFLALNPAFGRTQSDPALDCEGDECLKYLDKDAVLPPVAEDASSSSEGAAGAPAHNLEKPRINSYKGYVREAESGDASYYDKNGNQHHDFGTDDEIVGGRQRPEGEWIEKERGPNANRVCKNAFGEQVRDDLENLVQPKQALDYSKEIDLDSPDPDRPQRGKLTLREFQVCWGMKKLKKMPVVVIEPKRLPEDAPLRENGRAEIGAYAEHGKDGASGPGVLFSITWRPRDLKKPSYLKFGAGYSKGGYWMADVSGRMPIAIIPINEKAAFSFGPGGQLEASRSSVSYNAQVYAMIHNAKDALADYINVSGGWGRVTDVTNGFDGPYVYGQADARKSVTPNLEVEAGARVSFVDFVTDDRPGDDWRVRRIPNDGRIYQAKAGMIYYIPGSSLYLHLQLDGQHKRYSYMIEDSNDQTDRDVRIRDFDLKGMFGIGFAAPSYL